MKAFAITGPEQSKIEDVQEPVAGAGEVVVNISRVGICGTDEEFFSGEIYDVALHEIHAAFLQVLLLTHSCFLTLIGVGQTLV